MANQLIEMIHNREQSHHDQWADVTPVQEIRVKEAFEGLMAQEGAYIRKMIPDMRGKKILDVGCGLGEASVYFALQGARITAVDISPGMIKKTLELASYYGVDDSVTGIVATAESFKHLDTDFDIIHAANVFHHVADLRATLTSLHEKLRPGGKLVSWDPVKYNPVINIYRSMASENRTPDERPLGVADIEIFHQIFTKVSHQEFWFATLLIFLKYFLIDRYHPNDIKYWKQILTEGQSKSAWWWAPLKWLDDHIFLRIPFLKWLAWNTVIIAEK